VPVPRSLSESMLGALRDGQLQRFAEYEDHVLNEVADEYPEYVALIREIGPRDAMVVPLRARGRVIGVITLGMLRRSGRSFDADDEALAREIGERAGLGIDNARLFAEARAERAALQISEESRRLAVEAAGTGTWDFDMTRGTLIWDARCRELFGVSPGGPVDYETYLERVVPEDRARVDFAVRNPGPGGEIDIEYRARTDDGGERWMRSKGQALLTPDGQLSRLLGTVQDISDRKRTERELEVARQRAEEANKAKDEFLAMLGHELRNPLSPILTALQLMRMRNSEVMARERAVIERQVHHMVRLVDDLLDVSRITRRKVQLKRASIELAAVVDKALEMAAPLLEQRAHRLTLAVPRTGLTVDGDEHRLAQVVANLLTNAARYTESGGTISITGASEDGQAVLRVRDSGAGIDAELLPRVFDLFVQGRRSIDRADGGLGLGLTIVRSLVELHGGAVTASSAGPGQGSEFVVCLPLAAAGAGVAVDVVAVTPALRGSACRVLIVDDNRDAAELLAEVLDDAGHVTRIAFDGPGALRTAAEFRPQLALLDIGLPVMDGFELARRMRELPGLERVALVALTGYGQPADRERSRVAGFDMHLTKPVEVPELEAVVARFAAAAPGG
jgi:PAS domain S-box-containing protein